MPVTFSKGVSLFENGYNMQYLKWKTFFIRYIMYNERDIHACYWLNLHGNHWPLIFEKFKKNVI